MLKLELFFILKSKSGVLEIFLKSNILCTKILGTVKFFLKSKNFLKSNMLKSKIHCTVFTTKITGTVFMGNERSLMLSKKYDVHGYLIL